MIKSISIANTASYLNEPSVLSDMTNVNIIYGANGAGKTTISKVLSSPSKYPDCHIEWENNQKLDTYVYNTDFKQENFSLDKDIPGVFTLGKATKEQLEEIDAIKKEIGTLQSNINDTQNTLQLKIKERGDKDSIFNDYCWKSIKECYEKNFSHLMKGALNSKNKFAKMVLDKTNRKFSNPVLDFNSLLAKVKTLYSENLSAISLITQISNNYLAQIEEEKIWEKIIVGKTDIGLAELINKLNISDWVNQGRSLLDSDSDICPFCQQHTITEEFKQGLGKVFDDQYKADAEIIVSLIEQYKHNYSTIISCIDNTTQNQQYLDGGFFDVNELKNLRNEFKNIANENIHLMESKNGELSRSISLKSTTNITKAIIELIASANKKISKHNSQVDNVKQERVNLENEFWQFVYDKHRQTIDSQRKFIDSNDKAAFGLSESINRKQQRLDKLKDELRSANKNVTSIQPAIDEINKTLQNMGFTNFTIEASDNNKYQIKRSNGVLAKNTLSEGESTFITFLYFMQLIKGGRTEDNALTDRVIVIDDPVSSLDSTVLYIISATIRNLIDSLKEETNIKQVIILTHNIFFHKEISCVHRRSDNRKNFFSYWVLSKKQGCSSIGHRLTENPIKSSYELLWNDIRNWENTSALSLQNNLRRVFETYFMVFGGFQESNIISSFTDPEEKKICISLIGWINDGSHSIPDDFYFVPTDDEKIKYIAVFEQIFSKMGHKSHYDMMMSRPKPEHK